MTLTPRAKALLLLIADLCTAAAEMMRHLAQDPITERLAAVLKPGPFFTE